MLSASNRLPLYSRTGCDACKRRKKKCDEVTPICLACQRLGLSCSYSSSIRSRDNLQSQQRTRHTTLRAEQRPTGLLSSSVSSPRAARRLRPLAAAESSTAGLPSAIADSGLQDADNLAALQAAGPSAQSQLAESRALPIVCFSAREESIISRVPASFRQLYSPVSSVATRDMQPLMQMVLSDDLVRKASVACFSKILPNYSNQLGRLDREAFGSAIHILLTRLQRNIDVSDFATMFVSLVFLGLIEPRGTGKEDFDVTHWLALANLIQQAEARGVVRRLPLDGSLLLLVAEAVLYNFCVAALFKRNFEQVSQCWQHCRLGSLFRRIAKADINGRIPESPLLSGQYELWAIAFEVASLSRRRSFVTPKISRILRLAVQVQQIRLGLNGLYDEDTTNGASESERHCVTLTYRVFCIALLIALEALKPPTPERNSRIAALVSEGIKLVSAFDLIPICLAPFSWPLMVLALAVKEQEEWDTFTAKVAKLRLFMVNGHMRRLDAVMQQVWWVRDQKPIHDPQELPAALHLLQQPEGVLYDVLPDDAPDLMDDLMGRSSLGEFCPKCGDPLMHRCAIRDTTVLTR